MGVCVSHCGNPSTVYQRKRERQYPPPLHGFDGKPLGAIVQNAARVSSSLVLLVVVERAGQQGRNHPGLRGNEEAGDFRGTFI